MSKTIVEVCICAGYAYVITYYCPIEELAAASSKVDVVAGSKDEESASTTVELTLVNNDSEICSTE